MANKVDSMHEQSTPSKRKSQDGDDLASFLKTAATATLSHPEHFVNWCLVPCLARELAKRMMLNGFNDFNKYFIIWSLPT